VQSIRETWGSTEKRTGRLYSGSDFAQLSRRDALVRLPRAVREAARDLQEAEPPRIDPIVALVRVRGKTRRKPTEVMRDELSG
jgi:hypothetical protein